MIVRDIYEIIDNFAPFKYQEDFDNSGILLGDINRGVKKVLFTLDVSVESVVYAIENRCDLIVSHHPLIFNPIKSIDVSIGKGEILAKLIKNNISVISAHTNLDKAKKGVNYVLAELAGIAEKGQVLVEDDYFCGIGFGVVGSIPEENMIDYLEKFKNKISAPLVRLYNAKEKVNKVALMGGSGAGFIYEAKKAGADLFITGDVKYHDAQYAKESGISLADAGHFYTEYMGFKYLIIEMKGNFPNLNIVEFYKEYSNLSIL